MYKDVYEVPIHRAMCTWFNNVNVIYHLEVAVTHLTYISRKCIFVKSDFSFS